MEVTIEGRGSQVRLEKGEMMVSEDLIMSVGKGNPGAFVVIKELMWFTKWYQMMVWCKDNLSGADLWEKYKDIFHQDSNALGLWIEKEMIKDTHPDERKP